MTFTAHKKSKTPPVYNILKKLVFATCLIFFSTGSQVFSSDMPFTTLKYPEPGSFAKKESTDTKTCLLFICKEAKPVVTKIQLSK